MISPRIFLFVVSYIYIREWHWYRDEIGHTHGEEIRQQTHCDVNPQLDNCISFIHYVTRMLILVDFNCTDDDEDFFLNTKIL